MKFRTFLAGAVAVSSIATASSASDTKDYIGSQCDLVSALGNKSTHLLSNFTGVGQWISCPGISDNAAEFSRVTIDASTSMSNVRLTFRAVNAGTLYGFTWTSTTGLGGTNIRYNWSGFAWGGIVDPFAIEGILPNGGSIYRYAGVEFGSGGPD